MSHGQDPRLLYETAAADLGLPAPWRRYLALLAAAWFPGDAKAGASFLGLAGRPGADPLRVGAGLAPPGASLARGQHLAQLETGLALIETERAAFVKSELGRLASVIGAWHCDQESGLDLVFHPPAGASDRALDPRVRPAGAPPPVELPSAVRPPAAEEPDPYDLALSELASLPSLVKRVEKLGTLSWLPLFPVQAGQAERLALLARLWRKLTHETVCAAAEFASLLDGHQAWLEGLASSGPKVIAG